MQLDLSVVVQIIFKSYMRRRDFLRIFELNLLMLSIDFFFIRLYKSIDSQLSHDL